MNSLSARRPAAILMNSTAKTKPAAPRGRLIAVEGLDGSGKTTLSHKLASGLGAAWTTTPGPEVRDGGLRELADQCFTAPQARHLFYAAAVVQESARVDALLASGVDVVADRWWLTTWAYGQWSGTGLQLAEVERLVLPADATVWVDLPEAERSRRLLARGMTDADRATLRPGQGARLRALFHQGLRRPVAGRCLELQVMGLDPDGACSAALVRLAEVLGTPLAQGGGGRVSVQRAGQ